MKKRATLSPCGQYRYWLERQWLPDHMSRGFVNFILLNPSTADADVDDATVRKLIGFCKKWGYGALHVVNLFALRSTDPRQLQRVDDPIGPRNDWMIEASLLSAEKTIVGWGNWGNLHNRADQVLAICHEKAPGQIYALGLNANGTPKHPLYVPYSAELIKLTGGAS